MHTYLATQIRPRIVGKHNYSGLLSLIGQTYCTCSEQDWILIFLTNGDVECSLYMVIGFALH